MISGPDRLQMLALIDESVANGADRATSCETVGINQSTYYRWKQQLKNLGSTSDLRPTATRAEPDNKLSVEEKQRLLDTLHSSEFADSSPHQVVAALADQGQYIASVSTCYRLLRANNELQHRGRSNKPVHLDPPTHKACAPNQVWSWDITYLNGPIKGQFYYLYMIVDIFSRFIVGWEVWPEQLADYSAMLISKAALAEQITKKSTLILHSDNGSPMKAFTMLAKLQALGIEPSVSQPHVSNDNPFSESLFKTCKYRPNFQIDGFASLDAARQWCSTFVHWYNYEHHHSGIKYLTPHQRHHGLEEEITRKRKEVYEAAREAHPERWKGRKIRNWDAPSEVYLNRVNT